MRLYNFRVLGLSLGVGASIGLLGGLLYAWGTGGDLFYGVGAGLFIVGLIALGLGMLAATEPEGGWASRRNPNMERRSFVAQAADEHPRIERVTSLDLFVWALAVGGSLIAVSMLAFYVATSS